jgi:hypothetical protein
MHGEFPGFLRSTIPSDEPLEKQKPSQIMESPVSSPTLHRNRNLNRPFPTSKGSSTVKTARTRKNMAAAHRNCPEKTEILNRRSRRYQSSVFAILAAFCFENPEIGKIAEGD